MNPIQDIKDQQQFLIEILTAIRVMDMTNTWDKSMIESRIESRINNLEFDLRYYTDRKQKTIKCSSYYKEKTHGK